MSLNSNLNSISPIDGRYQKYTESLIPYFSELASMKYKILMECEYLIALSETLGVGMRKLNIKEKTAIRNLYETFSLNDAKIISAIELKGYKNIKAISVCHNMKQICGTQINLFADFDFYALVQRNVVAF